MNAFPDVTPLWDLSGHPDFAQLHDADFLSLLKQFPTSSIDSINPQNISSYPLPTLTPPSEDSSPSPTNSNHDPTNDDQDSALKRKASDDDLSDGPTQKSQHTSDKKSGARRKSGAATGKDEGRIMKRKEQNRAAQRAFRERKEKHVKDLEDKVAELQAKNENAQHENENLRDLLTRLQNENLALKQSSFTFTMPKSSPDPPVPTVPDRYPSSSFSPSPSTSTSPKSVHSTTLDWTSLASFDPSMLNLLDDSPQPTATEGAMQMDFGFGPSSALGSNPYTTIASNPTFMSFASTFDSFSPDINTPPSASGSTNFNGPAFNFDINSLSSWSTPATSQENALDDLFSGYLAPSVPALDGSPFTNSPASISPISHQVSPAAQTHISRSTRSASSSLSPPKEVVSPDKDRCPRTKQELEQRIAESGSSPFAPAVRKSTDVLGTVIACAGSNFPMTIKSDKNIEVLSAWKTIRADPKFKDTDINDLCSEFTSKARCDGTKVVLEPEGVHSILENLSKKQ